MATGSNWVLVKVWVKAKKKSFKPKVRQNMPATTNPGIASGRITSRTVVTGVLPSV